MKAGRSLGTCLLLSISFFLFLILLPVEKARGVSIINGNQVDTIRFLYFLINGAPNNAYPGGRSGPEGGFLGMIRQFNGPDGVGLVLSHNGYTTCGSLPASGTASMNIDNEGLYTITFKTPSKAIPAGYTGAGGNYEKSLSVDFEGDTFMHLEFNCDSPVGWIRFADFEEFSGGSAANARNLEMYWDTSSASSTKLELYMFYEDAGGNSKEYFMVKFATEADNKYKLWVTRAEDNGTPFGVRVAIYGDVTTDIANVFMFIENGSYNDNTTTQADGNSILAGGDVQCIDFNDGSGAADATGSCGSLGLSDPGAPLIDGSGNFSIQYASNTTTGLKTKLSAL